MVRLFVTRIRKERTMVRILNVEEARQRHQKAIAIMSTGKHGKSTMAMTALGGLLIGCADDSHDSYTVHPNAKNIEKIYVLETWGDGLTFLEAARAKKAGTVIVDPVSIYGFRLFLELMEGRKEDDAQARMHAYGTMTNRILQLLNTMRSLPVHFVGTFHIDSQDASFLLSRAERLAFEQAHGDAFLMVGDKLRKWAPAFFDMVGVVERKVMGNNLVYKFRTVPKANDEPVGHKYGPNVFLREEEPFIPDLIRKMLVAQGYKKLGTPDGVGIPTPDEGNKEGK